MSRFTNHAAPTLQWRGAKAALGQLRRSGGAGRGSLSFSSSGTEPVLRQTARRCISRKTGVLHG